MSLYIKISIVKMQDQLIHTINARDLHKHLGIKKDFSDWIKIQLKRGFFAEGVDFIIFPQKGENLDGRPKVEYALTVETAKAIGMMSATEKGKEIRDYFIACEKKLNARDAQIAEIRKVLLLDYPSEWQKLFYDGFFISLMKLHGHEFNGNRSTPSYCGKIIMDWVYKIVLPPELLRETIPIDKQQKRHQWFTESNGRNVLFSQISKVEMMAKISESRIDFENKCARAFLNAPLQLNLFVN